MRYQLKKHFSVKSIAGDSIIMARGSVALEFNGILVLNEACALICELIKEKPASLEEMADIIIQKYSIEKETALHDVETCINKMLEQDILDITG